MGATAALIALAIHSGFDFLWHLPVIPLCAGLFAGLAAPPHVPAPPPAAGSAKTSGPAVNADSDNSGDGADVRAGHASLKRESV
jgi:hypothetical protein